MTDDPKDTGPPGAEEDDTPSEEFAHSDRIRREARPTQPATPPEPAPEAEPDAAAETAPEDVAEDRADDDTDATTEAEPAADDTTAPDDETTAGAAPDEPTEIIEETDKPRTTSPLVPILAATTAVFFVATVLLGLMAFAPRFAPLKSGPAKLAVKAQEEDGLKVIAKRFAANFVSLDYKSIDEDLDRMTADATSNFATKLRETVERIAPAFKSRKASSTGTALDAAVLSHTDDSAIVQVLLRRTKKNVGTKGPETGNQIVNVTLVKTPDGWKVSDLSQLGAEDG